MIIDCYSRMVLGYTLSMKTPNAMTVLATIRHAMYPKPAINIDRQALGLSLEDLPMEKELRWEVAGIMSQVVMDNGGDFMSLSVRTGLDEFGIEVQFCPPKEPWYKAIIERFGRTMNMRLFHWLPGTTYGKVMRDNEYDATPLCQYLQALPPNTQEDTLGFADIERLLGQPLPSSALKYSPWWANQANVENRPQAKAWTSAGFKIDALRLGEGGWVRFKRASAAPIVQVAGHEQRAAIERPTRIEARPDPQAPVSYAPGTIALVSCVATKRPGKHAARDLYVSAWFKKVRQHVERAGLTWYILSAKYGLVAPDQEIGAYEMTLNNMGLQDRRTWAYDVMGQIAEQLPGHDRYALFAGARYREFLEPLLAAQGAKIQVPMEGLTQGRQLNWLDTHEAYVQT